MSSHFARLLREPDGTSVIEFALIAPAMLMLTLGTLQFAIDVYGDAVLKGAVQEAGRNSGLERATQSQGDIDNRIKDQLMSILPGALARTNDSVPLKRAL